MNYEETLDFLYHQLPVFQREGKAAYKANLNNTLALDAYFDHPHRSFKTVHVAGTNGKGSVSHMLSSVLQHAGYKVGLYTSPHLLDMRERIKVNGQMCPKDFVVDFVAKNMTEIQAIKPSFFELMVLMAFCYFKQEEVDVAIIEVGMGGRLDSTNVISPVLSVITNIGLDHTQFLGTSLPEIAREKAGIIKPQIPVVVGEFSPHTASVFEKTAASRNSHLYFASQQYALLNACLKDGLQELTLQQAEGTITYRIDLLGSYQKQNLITALSALKLLSNTFAIPPKHIHSGLANVTGTAGLQGRWQVLAQRPLVVCDTGHNREGLAYVVESLRQLKAPKYHLVLGLVNEKNAEEILGLFPPFAQFYLTRANIPRAMELARLATAARALHLSFAEQESVAEAVQNAREHAEPNDVIFIGGSTFVVADALAAFKP